MVEISMNQKHFLNHTFQLLHHTKLMLFINPCYCLWFFPLFSLFWHMLFHVFMRYMLLYVEVQLTRNIDLELLTKHMQFTNNIKTSKSQMALQTMIIMNVPSMMHWTIGGIKWKCDETFDCFYTWKWWSCK